ASGSHTYLDEGGKTVTAYDVGEGRGSGRATSRATINDAALSASGTANTFTEGNSKSVTVATFSDANPSATIADFSATTIDWGDGSTSTGAAVTISTISGGFAVSGSHTRSEERRVGNAGKTSEAAA